MGCVWRNRAVVCLCHSGRNALNGCRHVLSSSGILGTIHHFGIFGRNFELGLLKSHRKTAERVLPFSLSNLWCTGSVQFSCRCTSPGFAAEHSDSASSPVSAVLCGGRLACRLNASLKNTNRKTQTDYEPTTKVLAVPKSSLTGMCGKNGASTASFCFFYFRFFFFR